MAQYEKVFTKPYEDGYENLPSQNTPITASTLNDKDTAIEHIEDFLDGNEFPTSLADLSDDSTHRLVTDTEKTAWNGAVNKITENEQSGYLKNKNLWHYSLTHNNSFQYAYEMPSDARTFTISIKKTLAKQINACAYDGEGTKIVTDFKILGADETTGSYILTVNTACFLNIYVVGSVADDDSQVSEVQVEVGSTATAYMQYAPSNIELANSKADITSIGTDESGRTTASKAYAIGEHFYKDGKFCTAKTAIASGATFTLNTNYVEEDISSYLRNYTTQISVGTGVTLSKNQVSVCGKVVDVLLQYTTPSTSIDVTLGSSLKPSNDYVFLDVIDTAPPYTHLCKAFVRGSTGEIILRTNSPLSASSVYVTGTYITKD